MKCIFFIACTFLLAIAVVPAMAGGEIGDDITGTVVSGPVPQPTACKAGGSGKLYEVSEGSGKVTLCAVTNDGVDSGVDLRIAAIDENGKELPPQFKTNYPLGVYISEGALWRRALCSSGHSIRFIPSEKGGYPIIEVLWETGTAENHYPDFLPGDHDHKTLFVWGGRKFQDAELKEARRLDAQALALLRDGKRKAAIAKWKVAAAKARIPGFGLTAAADVLNNLGFAYLGMGEEYEGEKALRYALKVDPRRWSAHLNLADLYARDLYVDKERSSKSVEHYRQVLALKPDYRHADVIRKRIDDLSHGRGKFVDQRNSGVFLFRVRQDLPIYRFVIKKGDDGIPEKIEVYTETSKRPVQTLSISDSEEECTTPIDRESMKSADYNFDGNADIAFSCDRGVTGNETFMVWLFSPSERVFRQAQPGTLENPAPDPEDRIINSHWNLGSAGTEYIKKKTAFRNGKFVVVEEERQESTGQGNYLNIVSKLIDGKMREVSRKTVKVDLDEDREGQ
jgi:tetratricopeptide (TPR) repeat protein